MFFRKGKQRLRKVETVTRGHSARKQQNRTQTYVYYSKSKVPTYGAVQSSRWVGTVSALLSTVPPGRVPGKQQVLISVE